MPVTNNRPASRRNNGLVGRASTPQNLEGVLKADKVVPRLEDFIIIADEYEYPVEERVPHGYYFSEIKKLEPRIKNGRIMLDVSYEIRPTLGTDVYYIKQTYPEDSKPLKDFYKAMVAAGVKPGPNLKDAIGVEEIIALGYVSDNSDFGSIVKRKPNPGPMSQYNGDDEEDETDDDDAFDDLLSDDDE